MVDLINDTLRRRKHFQPHGWQTFARALKETNVPQELVGHQERWNWMQQQHDSPQVETAVLPKPTRKKITKRVVSTHGKRSSWSSY